MGAFLRGPSFLSGATDSEVAIRREQWRRQKFPDAVDRQERLSKAIAAVNIGGNALAGLVKEIAPAGGAGAEERRDRAAKALEEATA